jgi:alpha-galactosidase
VYRDIRSDLPAAIPFWPLGLPGWTDSWIALGMRAPAATYLTVWHRGGTAPGPLHSPDPAEASLLLPHLRGLPVTGRLLYPSTTTTSIAWDPATGTLAVSLPAPPSACLLKLTH